MPFLILPPARRATALGIVAESATPVATRGVACRPKVTLQAAAGAHSLHAAVFTHHAVASNDEKIWHRLCHLHSEVSRAGVQAGAKSKHLTVRSEGRAKGVVGDIGLEPDHRDVNVTRANLLLRDCDVTKRQGSLRYKICQPTEWKLQQRGTCSHDEAGGVSGILWPPRRR